MDVWGLFGLSKDDATLRDAKKAYFNLALIVHPDRNPGVKDEEMHVVIDGYKTICDEINKRDIENDIKACDDLKKYREEDVKKYDSETRDMPSFMDIYEETHDNVKKFNKYWEDMESGKLNDDDNTENMIRMASNFGYKTIKSEYNSIEGVVENVSYTANIDCDLKIDDTEYIKDEKLKNGIVSYNTQGSFGTSILQNNHNNFNDGKYCYDYKDAHVMPGLLHRRLGEDVIQMYDETHLENVDKLYEERCNEYGI